MLAYYVEWHLKQSLAPLLFEDEEIDATDPTATKSVRFIGSFPDLYPVTGRCKFS